MRVFWIYISVGALVLLSLGAGLYLYQNNNKKNNPDATPQTGQTPITPNQQSSPDNKTTSYPVSVNYSKKPESYDDPSKTFPLARTSPTVGVGTFVISELLKGPTTNEQAQGYFTHTKVRDGTSNCGGADFTLSVTGGTAVLKFCRAFDHVGSVSDGQAESQINDTLKQFNTVQRVIILNQNGDCEFNLSGLNLCKQ